MSIKIVIKEDCFEENMKTENHSSCLVCSEDCINKFIKIRYENKDEVTTIYYCSRECFFEHMKKIFEYRDGDEEMFEKFLKENYDKITFVLKGGG